jgi:hypothetical protein
MKTNKPYLSAAVLGIVIAVVLFLVLDVVAPAFSTSAVTWLLAPVSAPTPAPGDPIPLKSIAGLNSLNATVKLDVNGKIAGKKTKGDLNALLASNDQKKSKITVSGSLLGPIAAQVGGSVLGMFTPSKVDLYKVPTGAYIAVNSLVPICVKPDTADAAAALDELSPSSMMNMLTSSDVARGKFVGDEKLSNGTPVKHYVINGDAFLAAAQKSSDPKLKEFADALWSADDIDLYVDAKGGHPVALRGNFSGAFEPLKFEGDLGVQIELTGVNTNPKVELPSSCTKPISTK